MKQLFWVFSVRLLVLLPKQHGVKRLLVIV
jgi:hypothetical protein